jgi:membrane-bound lytic murein transglycosylase D
MEGSGGVTTMGANPAAAPASYSGSGNVIGPHDTNKPKLNESEMEEVEVLGISGKYNSAVIAKNLVMDIVQFNHYNPSFDNMLATAGTYDLRLPADKMQLFVSNKYQILNECVQVMLNDEAVIPANKFGNSNKLKTPGKKKRA